MKIKLNYMVWFIFLVFLTFLPIQKSAAFGTHRVPPLAEDFQSGELPHNYLVNVGGFWWWYYTEWSFSTNGPGRTEIAFDETDNYSEYILNSPYQTYSGGNRFRGNCYKCDKTVLLIKQKIFLNITNATTELKFNVYESSTSNGTYSLISSSTVTPGTGNGFFSSGDINVKLTAGKYYIIGAGWDQSVTYYYAETNQINTSFGNTFAGYQISSYPPGDPANGSQVSLFQYRQELVLSTNYVVRMDGATGSGTRYTNTMDIATKLQGFDDVTLTFRHRDANDEQDPGDGIFISVDGGTNFTKIYSLSTSANWQNLSLDIDYYAALNGLTLSDNTIIRFQQTDDTYWPYDGREFDDIKLFAKPDLLLNYVSASSSFLWKGFSTTKDIPISLGINKNAGNSSLNVPNVNFSYSLKQSGTILMTDTVTQNITMEPMTKTSESVNNTLHIPASWHLSGLYYDIAGEADTTDIINEALENNNTNSKTITVNHYSGNLWFGDIVTDIDITDWGVRSTGSPSAHWITGTGNINGGTFSFTHLRVTKDLSSLDYIMVDTNVINVSFPDRYTVANVSYWHPGGVNLSTNGAYGTLDVLLPAGMAVSTNEMYVMNPILTFKDEKLGQQLYPTNSVRINGNFKIAEETKPVILYSDWISWNPATGMFGLDIDDAVYTRAGDLQKLDNDKSAGNITAEMAIKRSNDTYYRNTSGSYSYPYILTGSNGESLLNDILIVEDTEMFAHFPYDVYQGWYDNSYIYITNDLLATNSILFSPADSQISYNPDCSNVPCAGTAGMENITIKTSSDTYLSPNGGYRTIVNFDHALHWGTRYDNSSAAQQTSTFNSGNLFIAGNFLRGDQSVSGIDKDFGPAEILLSGMYTNNDSSLSMERYGTPEYAEGLADYAGLNIRAQRDSQYGGRSIIGGTDTDWWGLTGRSKYYLRYSGVSGIHEAVPGSFPSTLTIYGYNFTFSNYGLSYLSGNTKESRINGSVKLPFPSDITMAFEQLMICCIGELEEAQLANSDTKTLSYWDAVIQPLTLFFAPVAGQSCATASRVLCMGLTTHCANVDKTLSGTLGFLSSGDLASPATHIENVPSRLSVPNAFELDGPTNEVYYFNPVAMPYFNSYALSGDDAAKRGWINFAGNLDVAFFSDMHIHFHTSASTNSAIAPIYMMGGWTESATNTFFNSDPDKFDEDNAGFPYSAVTYDQYRHPTTDEYRAHAQRSWLNLINLDYPLEWSSATKSFKSPDAQTVDLLVLQAQHQTDYLSAENADISFGMQYDGLPQISIANIAFNVIDEATGISSAFSSAVGDALHGTVELGLSAMDNTLADLPEQLFEPVLKQVVDPLIDDFYTDLYNAYTNAPNTDYYGSVVTQYIYGVGNPAGQNIKYMLKHLADNASAAATLTGEINDNLTHAISMIDAFTGIVSVDTNGVSLPNDLPGILHISNDGNYQTLTDLGKGVLSVLSETLYDSLKDDINDELNSVLDDAAPSLQAITDTMNDLSDLLKQATNQLATAGSIATQLADALNSVDLDSPIDTMANEINKWFAALPGNDSAFDQYTPDEIKAMIRKQITDYFYGSMPVANVQEILRSRLYELDASIRESIDSSFQQLNKAMRDIVSQYMSGIDDSINGVLGDISDVMGSGQINGYAHIKGDTLTELRVDGKFQWKVPSDMDFNAFLLIKQLNSSAAAGCGAAGADLPEVTIGTKGFGLGWLGCDIKADISAKFAFISTNNTVSLIGLGGSFEMVEGEIGFESFAITKLYAAVAFGALENYISANLKCNFTDYEVEGGAFFGKACSLDPFSWDPDVQSILGDPPFEGIYVYGEAWIPIIDYGCFFQIRAGVGAGIFAFTDGRIGGKILLGADGEAICVVSVGGEIKLVGMKEGSNLRMRGTGTIKGRVGACPFCVKFSKSVTFIYDNGDWDVDY